MERFSHTTATIAGFVGAIGAISLQDINLMLGCLSAGFGIIYTGSMLFWGWRKYLRANKAKKEAVIQE